MVWFLDASVLLACEDADDRNHESSLRLMTGTGPLATLDLAYFEVVNVAIRSWHDGDAAQRSIDRIDAIAEDRGLIRIDGELIGMSAQIASAEGISAYDAAYAAAARTVDAELVSCDERDLVGRGLARLPSDVR